jgi:hypothetical protein
VDTRHGGRGRHPHDGHVTVEQGSYLKDTITLGKKIRAAYGFGEAQVALTGEPPQRMMTVTYARQEDTATTPEKRTFEMKSVADFAKFNYDGDIKAVQIMRVVCREQRGGGGCSKATETRFEQEYKLEQPQPKKAANPKDPVPARTK